ncbi:hypothetical protein BV25DRAFT_1825987 [Artomyces pyxidatus]|uniref:Uncharacterized protein n=1 Tax=Artomyces pyxidatus TaxID=48021 RepID=A0ACB8T1Y4_9AGAM|nr:hypothetical protein BV25DRAFT_1825987 [Artomyces pyxidatus]
MRVFTASDGRAYRWILGALTCWLKPDDGSDVEIARYHPRKLGIFGKARKAFLEVSPDGVPILDELIMTFIWVEMRRRDREKPTKTRGTAK